MASSIEDKSLRQLLDGIQLSQRRDIHAFSGGHLNEANLYKQPARLFGQTTWASAKKEIPRMVPKSQIYKVSGSMIDHYYVTEIHYYSNIYGTMLEFNVPKI